ncbi:MAG: hypothetical protein IPK67_06525 [Planctomycetes bacterium]|nr:hypothetical protein [Planctomycetota bacterium]
MTDEDRALHLGCVTAAIMQSVAALEADIWDVLNHGPGHHLGSNVVDASARELLLPAAEAIDRQELLTRYSLVLHLLGRQPMDPGAEPWQGAALLVRLRNEITHYKSRWGSKRNQEKFFTTLQTKIRRPPSFVPDLGVNFFPLQCLSAERAAWAVETTDAYISVFYVALGIRSPLMPRSPKEFSPRT